MGPELDALAAVRKNSLTMALGSSLFSCHGQAMLDKALIIRGVSYQKGVKPLYASPLTSNIGR